MLNVVKLHNFKTFLNAEVDFTDRHLLIGRNGSGKTNLIKALQFLSRAVSGDLAVASSFLPGGIAEVCNWYLKSDQFELSCGCTLDFEGTSYEYEYKLRLQVEVPTMTFPQREATLRVLDERLTVDGDKFNNVVLLESDGQRASVLNEQKHLARKRFLTTKATAPTGCTVLSKLYDVTVNQRAILFRSYLQNWEYYSISPLAIRLGGSGLTSLPTNELGILDSFGQQLANAIFHLKNLDELRYRRLIKHTRIIEPSLEVIGFLSVPGQAPVPFVGLTDRQKASWNGLSDGTLRALALCLIIELASNFSPPNWPVPCLAMIEEPENGIAPGQLRRIFDLFEEWAPNAQFIFTSHSPYFIDMFDGKRESVTLFRKATDRTESMHPRPDDLPDEDEDNEHLPLSLQYALELIE